MERLVNGEKFSPAPAPNPVKVAITCKMMPDADNANVYGTKRLDGYTVETTYARLADMYGGIWKEYGTEQKI